MLFILFKVSATKAKITGATRQREKEIQKSGQDFWVGKCWKPSTLTDTPHRSRGTGRENWKKKNQKIVSQDKCSLRREGKNKKEKEKNKEVQEIHSSPPQAEQCSASPQKQHLRSQTPPACFLPVFIAPHNILWHRISPWPLGASWVPISPLTHP